METLVQKVDHLNFPQQPGDLDRGAGAAAAAPPVILDKDIFCNSGKLTPNSKQWLVPGSVDADFRDGRP